mmetsp:Transcript_23252/g.58810  ORF Transcript_23252/g.58810 Transcript_23252/m.58810 type:complete len:208 (-) Transcript_23252:2960-3583(-)
MVWTEGRRRWLGCTAFCRIAEFNLGEEAGAPEEGSSLAFFVPASVKYRSFSGLLSRGLGPAEENETALPLRPPRADDILDEGSPRALPLPGRAADPPSSSSPASLSSTRPSALTADVICSMRARISAGSFFDALMSCRRWCRALSFGVSLSSCSSAALKFVNERPVVRGSTLADEADSGSGPPPRAPPLPLPSCEIEDVTARFSAIT